ncbi:hypothetical protein NDU88_000003 [Pleurodeles waltl]|uniref:Uncharacterized protein n=1 Tax=Pleurodeles waltl TaxID=8319 RepID=A0AAV7S3X3_PLEWA|nr:hypothetical protein NDU88_000003 [Pleurodeles waltl]
MARSKQEATRPREEGSRRRLTPGTLTEMTTADCQETGGSNVLKPTTLWKASPNQDRRRERGVKDSELKPTDYNTP